MEKIIAGLDLGSSNIRCAVCKVKTGNAVELLGFVSVPSNGISAGVITDMDEATTSISKVLKRQEQTLKLRIGELYAGISGSALSGVEASGMAALGKKPRQVTGRDIEECVKIAGMIKLNENIEVIHKEANAFYINEGEKVSDPLGMYATKLGVKLYVLTAESAKIKNIYKCVEDTGFALNGVIFSGKAVSASILKKDDAKLKVAVIDMGSHSTNIYVFTNNCAVFMNSFQSGARQINSGEDAGKLLSTLKIALDDKHIDKIYMTGGGALLDNMIENAEAVFGKNCELGRINAQQFHLSSADSLSHVVSLGVALARARSMASTAPENPINKAMDYISYLLESYF